MPIVLLALIVAVGFLLWAINSGQYDDLDKEGQRILFDEPDAESKNIDKHQRGRSETNNKTRNDLNANDTSSQTKSDSNDEPPGVR